MTEPMIEETEAEVPEFTEELSDEALDREQGEVMASSFCNWPRCFVADR